MNVFSALPDPATASCIFSRTGPPITHTQVMVQILRLTPVIDGQLWQENSEQVKFSEDLARKNLGIQTLDFLTCADLS